VQVRQPTSTPALGEYAWPSVAVREREGQQRRYPFSGGVMPGWYCTPVERPQQVFPAGGLRNPWEQRRPVAEHRERHGNMTPAEAIGLGQARNPARSILRAKPTDDSPHVLIEINRGAQRPQGMANIIMPELIPVDLLRLGALAWLGR